jgi:hypothetical protein
LSSHAVPALDILLFTVDAALARRALAADVAGLVVDWEDRGASIDRGACDNGSGPDTVDDLRRIAGIAAGRVVCRLNPAGPASSDEVELAIDHGATDLLVPMVERPGELSAVQAMAGGRARVGVMIETVEACRNASEIARAGPAFVYVGLLDLAISRGEGNVFRPLADGTADRLREQFAGTRFGIGGITVADGGSPVPCAVLMAEMARVRSDFVFARRSYLRDTAGRDLVEEGARLRTLWCQLNARDAARVARDHDEFVERFGQSWAR